jgi:hypothetical protein
MMMPNRVRITAIVAIVTGIVFIIPSHVIAQEIMGGTEVVTRWVALGMTFISMLFSAGIAYGMTKATVRVQLSWFKEELDKQGKLLDSIFKKLDERPTIEFWRDIRVLEERAHNAELNAMNSSIEEVKISIRDIRNLLGDRREGGSE